MISLVITRAGLSLPDLVATDDPGGEAVLTEDGLAEPATEWRYGHTPPSGDMHGRVLLTAVKENASLPLTINVRGSSAANLRSLKQEWTDALEQWSYTATLTVDGEGDTWSCDPTSPNWGDLDSGMARAYMARANVVIPVYPIPTGV